MKTYNYGSDEAQFAHLYKPDSPIKPMPIVCVIHGGYWKDNHDLNSYATSSIVKYLVTKGIAVWNIEYRRMETLGDNTQAPWPSTLEDVANAIDYLRDVAEQEQLNLSQFSVIGHSAGGHLALWAASRKNISPNSSLFKVNALEVKSVLSIAGVVELRAPEDLDQPVQIEKLMGGKYNELPDRYSASNPAELIPDNVKVRLMHGTNDPTVSVQQALRYKKLAKNKAEVTLLEGADHFSMLPHDGQWNELHWLSLTSLIDQMLLDEPASSF